MTPSHFRNPLILSCQPVRGGALDQPQIVAAYARMAEELGLGGVRIESLADLRAARPVTGLPVIALVKRTSRDNDIYITPDLTDVAALAEAGANIIAFDATARPRPVAVQDMVAAIHEHGCLAMADIATYQEGLASARAGADFVATTLSGYTDDSPQLKGPDLKLVRDLAEAGLPVIAEGRVHTPVALQQALAAGALAVTVGSAITRPEVITQRFLDALRPGREQ